MSARIVELAGAKRCPTRPNDVGIREAQIAFAPPSRPLCSRLMRGQGDAFGVMTKGRGGLLGKSILKPDEPFFCAGVCGGFGWTFYEASMRAG